MMSGSGCSRDPFELGLAVTGFQMAVTGTGIPEYREKSDDCRDKDDFTEGRRLLWLGLRRRR